MILHHVIGWSPAHRAPGIGGRINRGQHVGLGPGIGLEIVELVGAGPSPGEMWRGRMGAGLDDYTRLLDRWVAGDPSADKQAIEGPRYQLQRARPQIPLPCEYRIRMPLVDRR